MIMRRLLVSRGRRFWLSVAVVAVVVAGAAALGYLAYTWATGGEEWAGTVEAVGPEGHDVSRMSPVTIEVSGHVNRDLLRENLTMSPAVSGSATWKGDALVFQPEWPGYARGVSYAVDIPTPVATRAGLSGPVSFDFTIEGKLAVDMVVPEDDSTEIPLDSAVLVQFNRPVAPLTVLEEESPTGVVLQFEPSVAGSGKWLNSTTYVFRPDSTFQPSTTYQVTVPTTVSDTLGGSLEEAYVWSFTTVAPAVAEVFPEENTQYVGPNEGIEVTFNQPMDRASAEAHFSLVVDSTGVPVAGIFSWTDDTTFVFQPSQPLALSTRYEATVAAGAAALGKPEATTTSDFAWRFTTVGLPGISTTSPYNGATQVEIWGVDITFVGPMDEESVEENIVISPAPEDEDQVYSYWDVSSARLHLYFPMDYSMSYSITIPAGVEDRYGQALASDFVLTFTTAARKPGLSILKAGNVGTFDAYGQPQLTVHSWNVSRLDFALYSIDRQKLLYLAWNYDAFHSFLPPADSVVRSWSQEVPDAPLNETVVTATALALEDGGRLEPGYYFLRVLPANGGTGAGDRILLVVSKTHLLVKRADTQVMVWAVDMASGDALAGLPVAVYDKSSRRLAGGQTDDEGVFLGSVSDTLDYWETLYVAADRPGDVSLASTDWSSGISPWEFGLEPDYGPREYAGHIYTDRPIYRPGQTVYYKGILRLDDDASYSLPPPGTEGTIVISDSMGREVTSEPLALNDFGTFNGELTLSSEAPTGSYSIRLETEKEKKDYYYPAAAYASFLVAEYRKPEFEVKVTPDKEAYSNGEEMVIEVEASYFFGAPVADAPVEWRVTSRDFYFRDPEGRRYSFTDYEASHDPWAYPTERPHSDGVAQTDAEGHLTLRLPADVSTVPLSQTFTIEATVTDVNNQQVSNRAEVVVHKGAFYIGLKPRSYVSTAGEPVTVDVLTVDTEGEIAPDVSMTVSIYERRWVSVKEKDPEGGYYWRSEPEDTLVETQTVTTDAQGEASLTFTPAKGGAHRVVAEALDEAGNSVRSATFVWVSSSDYIPWRVDTDNRIELVADKDEYAPGETAKILVASPFEDSQGLITIERGKVIEHRLGRFPTNSTVLEVPITSAHIPNIYVSVALFKPPTEENPVSSFKLGYVELGVSTDEKVIDVTIEPSAEELEPRDSVTYSITTADSEGEPLPAEVSLALVDMAVLSLADETTPKPLQAFYERRGLGVHTAATYMASLDRFLQLGGAQPAAPGGKGGGGGGGLPGEVRRFFPDTAYWNPSVRTDDNGRATVTVELPDNLTTWRLTAKAVNKETQVGDATSDIVTSKDLLIRPVVPRFFVTGDTVRLEAIVHNQSDESLDVEVKLSAEGLAIDGDASQSLTIPAGEEREVTWDTTVEAHDQAVLTFSAKAKGGLSDAVELTLPVYIYGTAEVVGTAGEVLDAVKEIVRIPSYIQPDRGELTLELSPSLAASMRYSLRYVEEYGYECVEQTVSRFLPRLVLHRAINELGLPDTEDIGSDLPGLVTRSIQRLYRYQNMDGGWGWWGNDTSNPQTTAYAFFGLTEAERAGFSIDEYVLERASDYLYSYLGQPSDALHPQSPDTRAFILFALAQADQGDLGLTNALAERPATLSYYGKAFLAMALLELTDDPSNFRIRSLISDLTSNAIVSSTGSHWQEEEEDYRNMNTATRSTAIVLDALVRIEPDHPLVESTVRWLMVARDEGHWESTQETAMSLLALTDFLEASGELEADYSYQVRVNDDTLSERKVDSSNLTEAEELVVAMSDLLLGEDNDVRIARSSAEAPGRLYYTMHLRYFPPAEVVEAANYGVSVSREYLSAEEGEDQAIADADLSELVKVRLTVVAPTDLHYVVVEDFLPAGLEPVDTSLKTTSLEIREMLQEEQQGPASWRRGPGSGWWFGPYSYFTHVDMRDNRVVLFATYLPRGVHEYTYFLQATTAGQYRVMPAKAYEMYFPEVWGRTDGGIFTVNP